MIPNYPYYGLPNYMRFMHPNSSSLSNSRFANQKQNANNSPPKQNTFTNSSSTHTVEKRLQENEPIFNLLGMDLYFDDILLICLIFFLYTEGVNDYLLFFTLVLLLLS